MRERYDRTPSYAWLVAAAIAVALAVISAPTLRAQEPTDTVPSLRSRIVGRITDEVTGRPVVQALIVISPGTRRTLTDSLGVYWVLDLPPGDYELEVRQLGFAERTVEVRVEPTRTTQVDIQLTSDPVQVETLHVQIDYRPRYLEDRGFYDRMAEDNGYFFDPGWVDRWSSGIMRAGALIGMLQYHAPQPFGPCVTTYIDGHRDFSGLLGEMSPWEIGAIEYYPSAFGTPTFAVDGCGAIAVWTRRDEPDPARYERDIELCVPEFADGTITVEGLVWDSYTNVLLPGADVKASYRRDNGTLREVTVLADHAGQYRVCDLPEDAEITITASTLDRIGTGLMLPPGDRVVHQLNLDIVVSGPGRIAGRVIDRETGRPIASASVTLAGDSVTRVSDANGAFTFEEALPGDQTLLVAHLAYETLSETISIEADRTIDVRAELSADPIELEPIVVTAVRNRRLDRRGFYDRKIWAERLGAGEFFLEDQITRRNPIHVSHLARDVPGVFTQCTTRGCVVGTRCGPMSVYLDGVQVIRSGEATGAPVTIDELVRPVEVAAVEVYTGPAGLPAEYSGATGQCGALVIWTK